MRYQSTTGLCEETIDEITCRIADVTEGRGKNLSTSRIPLQDHVVTCQLILRQNLPQMVVADLLGVSQPTISRILATYHRPPRNSPALPPWRTHEAIQQGHLILIDGTHDPYREPPRPADKPATTTPGNTSSSTSMSKSPPPTAVTSSPSLTRCRNPDSHQPVWLAKPPRLLRRHLDRRHRLHHHHRHHPDQEATQPVPHQPQQRLQHCHRPNPPQHRTLHRTTKTRRILSHGYRRRLKELPGIIHLVTNLEILRTYTHNQPRK